MATPQPLMWEIMQMSWKKGEVLDLQEIYRIVERGINLEEDDFEPSAPSTNEPKWQRRVRNILQYRKGTGDIEWLGDGKYKR